MIEILQNVLSIHALRSRCKTEKNIRSEVTENSLIAVRYRMMEFVDYDVVVIVCGKTSDQIPIQALYRSEKHGLILRLPAVHQEISELRFSENRREGKLALLQNFPPVRDKEKVRLTPLL